MYFVLVITTIILAVLLCPIYLNIEFNNALSVKIKILFLRFIIFPQRDADGEALEDKSTGSKKENNKIKDLINQRGLKGFLNILKEMGKIISGMGKKIGSKVVIDNLNAFVKVSGEDSAKTAIRYGQVCACVFPFTNAILRHFKVKNYDVKVYPNFMNDITEVKFSLKVHLKLIWLIYVVIWAFIKFIKSLYLKPVRFKS